MKLTITLDNLDDAIKQLSELAKQLRQFPEDVADESKNSVGYEQMMVEMSPGMHKIKAIGDGIAFAEYGAGFVADDTTLELEDGGTLNSYPGVWSNDHEKTFQQHMFKILYGKALESDYKYNREPQRKMQTEAERLRNQTELKAKDYFR